MARSRGTNPRLVRGRGGVRPAIVLLALFAATLQLVLAGHVPMGGHPAPPPLLSGDPHALHRHAEHGGKPAPREKPGHGQSGPVCNLCAVCSGTAPPLPAADAQAVAPCPRPATVDDARRDGAHAARHFLTSLRPRAPPSMARSRNC